MKLQDAETLCDMLIERLKPACLKVEVAGSVRRKKPEVKDLEIVCVPIIEAVPVLELFGVSGASTLVNQLDDAILHLLHAKALAYDTKTPRDGPKYKRFLVAYPYEPIALDLFIAEPDNYGNVMAIRTGNADFSKALVTKRQFGGLMPSGLQQEGGYLWHEGNQIPCPNETDFFSELMIPWVEPPDRNLATAQRIAKELMRQK